MHPRGRTLAASSTCAALAQCTYAPTEVLVVLDSDAPADRASAITATVRVGDATTGASGSVQTFAFGADGGAVPASFAIVPRSGPRDANVSLVVDARLAAGGAGDPALALRRVALFAFTPRTTTRVPIFLATPCGAADTGCTSVAADACTRSIHCEDQGQTCGNDGTCTDRHVTPTPVGPDSGFGDTGARSFDAGGVADTGGTDVAADAARVDAAVCAGTVCAGACVDTTSDSAHCGGCTTVCGAGSGCSAGACTPDRISYSLGTASVPFIDACTSPGMRVVLASTDDGAVMDTLPFAFTMFSSHATRAWIGTNGVVGFGAFDPVGGLRCITDCPPSTTLAVDTIYAFGDDLQTRAGGVCIATVGPAPGRSYVVTWNDIDFSAGLPERGDMTFSLILREGTDRIDIVYQTMTGNTRAMGYWALIGMQDTTRAMSQYYACGSGAPRIASNTAVSFTPL